MKKARLGAVHPVLPSRDVRAAIDYYGRLGFSLQFQDSKDDPFHNKTALRETAWGTREFGFFDPDKNGLTFYCDLENDA